jgi:hypothetical protein
MQRVAEQLLALLPGRVIVMLLWPIAYYVAYAALGALVAAAALLLFVQLRVRICLGYSFLSHMQPHATPHVLAF